MQPSSAIHRQNGLPIEIVRLALRNRGIPPVRASHRRANSKSALGEIKAVAHASTNPVIRNPADQRCIDPSLEDQIFEQLADRVLCEGRNDRSAHTEATPESAGDVIFSPALPCPKISSGINALLAGIEPQHHLAQADAVPLATPGRS